MRNTSKTPEQAEAIMQGVSDELLGRRLAGNDLDMDGLASWYADEEKGFYKVLLENISQQDAQIYHESELNRFHASIINNLHFDTVLAFGCANGDDVLSLPITVGRYIAIEPTTEWWSDKIGGRPAHYLKPSISGIIDVESSTVDLVTAFGALHHVANVEFVVGELCRILKPGGYIIIREPVTSMGDFRVDRAGLTKRERGIPPAMMKCFLRQAGVQILSSRYSSVTAFSKLMKQVGIKIPTRNRIFVRIDYLLSFVLSFNSRYYRPKLLDKLAPSSMVYVGRKLENF